jgi:hypothetical protein
VESVTSNVPLDVNVWMVYSPDVVTVPPVAREEEHEPLGDAGDAGDGAAALGSLYTRTLPPSVMTSSFKCAPMATYVPSPESDTWVVDPISPINVNPISPSSEYESPGCSSFIDPVVIHWFVAESRLYRRVNDFPLRRSPWRSARTAMSEPSSDMSTEYPKW